VPKSRNDIPCLKLSIHAPGRGSRSISFGNAESTRYGNDKPIPIAAKAVKNWNAGKPTATPMASPRNGAEQGVATTVANTPEKNDPAKPCFACKLPPTEVADVPISKTPNRLSASTNISRSSASTTRGSWSW